jgi:hypothetical protein
MQLIFLPTPPHTGNFGMLIRYLFCKLFNIAMLATEIMYHELEMQNYFMNDESRHMDRVWT